MVIRNVTLTRPGSRIAGVNINYGDTARFSGVTIVNDPGRAMIVCQKYIGNNTGDEPSRSNNFRGQAHVSLAVPLSRSFALDISVAGTLTQQVDREPGYMTNLDEPLGYLRLGVGVRYGSR